MTKFNVNIPMAVESPFNYLSEEDLVKEHPVDTLVGEDAAVGWE